LFLLWQEPKMPNGLQVSCTDVEATRHIWPLCDQAPKQVVNLRILNWRNVSRPGIVLSVVNGRKQQIVPAIHPAWSQERQRLWHIQGHIKQQIQTRADACLSTPPAIPDGVNGLTVRNNLAGSQRNAERYIPDRCQVVDRTGIKVSAIRLQIERVVRKSRTDG
jgi:hypothetical protein